ncbi:MAG TPA: GntR family transcriptional regulator [Spirochaetia bacterium]
MVQLEKRRDTTLVMQLTDILLEQIRTGHLAPGDKIPSERELTKLYGVSRATARNTILGLAGRGVVNRAIGSGSYITRDLDIDAITTAKNGTVGFLVGRQRVPVRSIQDDFYYYRVMEGIQGELHAAKKHLIFSYLDDDESENRSIVEELARKVDGLLLAETGSRELVSHVGRLGLPCVLINPSIDDIEQRYDSLSVNNMSGAHKVVRYLLGLGHRAIGCIRGPRSSLAARDRYDGYVRALGEEGIDAEEALVLQVDGWTVDDGNAAARTLIARAPRITALFCASDTLAIGAIAGLKDLRRIPEELSIVGFDDTTLSSHSTPPLTTVHSPTLDLGRQAGRQILQRIRSSSLPVTRVLLSPELTVRESCRPLTR